VPAGIRWLTTITLNELLAALVLLSTLIPLVAQAPANLPSRLQAIMRDFDAEGFSGVVLVERQGTIEFLQAYGYADRRRQIRNTPDTRFEMASLTKPFTAAAILKLQEQGKLRTSDRLDRYIGPLNPPKNLATIHHLALHRAGLVVRGAELSGDSRESFLRAIRISPAESKPGERYRYTNAGYGVMAAIIEIVSGTSYNDYLRREILLPLGLREVYFRGEKAPGLALGYQKPPDDPEPTTTPSFAWSHGAGGLMISVPDLHMAFNGLRSGKVLSQASLEIMFHPWPDEGYGWHVRKDAAGRRLIEKGGGLPSYASHLLHYPDDQVTIIWATNSLHKRFRAELNRRLCEAVLGVTVPK
jgi:CubicO group peptidase (beta-lactamase class C family)